MRARSTPAVVMGGWGWGECILLLVGFWTVLKQLGFFLYLKKEIKSFSITYYFVPFKKELALVLFFS